MLNPLFLDDLRAKLEEAGNNGRKLLNLRNRMARIRVFDPACGSGNFLVIAYKEMRAIEAEINVRRGEPDSRSDIPLTNFRGIELREFPAEIARLALIIAEYQSDVLYRGQREALVDFLPLSAENWVTCGNALKIDWQSICPPTGAGVRLATSDLFEAASDQAEIDFENEGGETYICGNPPYIGSRWRDKEQQEDMARVFEPYSKSYKDLDYVACWFVKAASYASRNRAHFAFVATNSICQGEQVAMLWPIILNMPLQIQFCWSPFKWTNLAANAAGVTVVIVGVSPRNAKCRRIYLDGAVRSCDNIGPYLIPMDNIIVAKRSKAVSELPKMDYGNKPTDGGNLILTRGEASALVREFPIADKVVKKFIGSDEFVKGTERYCLWISDEDTWIIDKVSEIARRVEAVKRLRTDSVGQQANANASTPHKFVFAPHQSGNAIIVPRVTSEKRPYLPAGLVNGDVVVSDRAAVIYRAPLWSLALIVSKMHWVWVSAVCMRLETRFSYSNTIGWNTFPVPRLTEQNRLDLTRCAENILLAREAHFPATIADLYNPDAMPDDLRRAHEANDEVLERIYVGRRFRNDTERLEKLFELYTRMTGKPNTSKADA